MRRSTPTTVRISADSEERLYEGIVKFADNLSDSGNAVSIRLGKGFADLVLVPRPLNAGRE